MNILTPTKEKLILNTENQFTVAPKAGTDFYCIETNSFYLGEYSKESAKKVLQHIAYCIQEYADSNFIYEMPLEEEVASLKFQIKNKKKALRVKKIAKTTTGKIDEQINQFLEENNIQDIIDIKSSDYDVLILYNEPVEQQPNVIEKKDIVAIELPNTERKIYNIVEEGE